MGMILLIDGYQWVIHHGCYGSWYSWEWYHSLLIHLMIYQWVIYGNNIIHCLFTWWLSVKICHSCYGSLYSWEQYYPLMIIRVICHGCYGSLYRMIYCGCHDGHSLPWSWLIHWYISVMVNDKIDKLVV